MYCITKWCKSITDSGRDEYTGRQAPMIKHYTEKYGEKPDALHRFRLLDADEIIYAYGVSTEPDSFAPLDYYMPAYGCVEIQYKDPKTGKYETL